MIIKKHQSDTFNQNSLDNFNKLFPTSGTSEGGKQLKRWDPVQRCTGVDNIDLLDRQELIDLIEEKKLGIVWIEEDTTDVPTKDLREQIWAVVGKFACALSRECPYKKRGRCKLELNYLNAIYVPLTDEKEGLGKLMSDTDMQRVGYHLMPLYHQLIRLKKEAFVIQKMVCVTGKGTFSINPVFREIRSVIKAINDEIGILRLDEKWVVKLGVQEKPAGKGSGKKKVKEPSIQELLDKQMIEGNPDHFKESEGQ